MRQPRTNKQERHHDRASTFYKMVLRWQKDHHGGHGRNSRQAAMGLPEAVMMSDAKRHVKNFLDSARADGVPPAVLARLILELVLQKG